MNIEYMTSANEEKMFDLLNNLGNNQKCFCTKSYVRFLNAITNSSGVDIYIDGIMVADNLYEGEFTSYLMVYPDTYKYKVYKAGTTTNPIVDSEIVIKKNTEYTAAITGNMNDLANICIVMVDNQRENTPPVRTAIIKFTNLLSGCDPLNLVLDDGTILYKDIAYKDSTPNIMLVPGVYTFSLVIADTNKNIITLPDIELNRNTYYQMFSIGSYTENNGVEVLIPESGLNFLDLC